MCQINAKCVKSRSAKYVKHPNAKCVKLTSSAKCVKNINAKCVKLTRSQTCENGLRKNYVEATVIGWISLKLNFYVILYAHAPSFGLGSYFVSTISVSHFHMFADLVSLTHLALIFLTHLAELVSLTHLELGCLTHLADLLLTHLALI